MHSAVGLIMRLVSAPPTGTGVIFHTDSRDRTSLSPRWFKQPECVSHRALLSSFTALRTFQSGWINSWPLKRKCLQAGLVLLYRISADHTHLPHSHFWQESLRSDVTHQPWQSRAKFCYSLTMTVELFPLLLFFPLIVNHSVFQSLMCAGILESTLFYWNLHTVKIRSHTHTSLTTTWQLRRFISHKSVVRELYQPVGICFVSSRIRDKTLQQTCVPKDKRPG